jgi:hypothetical protein
MKDAESISSFPQGAYIEVAMNQLVEMVRTIPEKLNGIHPEVGVDGNLKEGQVGNSETVAEECESRSAPDETTSRGATDENESRFDDLASIDEVASSITANMSRFSVEAQLSADEFAKALIMAVDGYKSHFSPEQQMEISPEQKAEIQEEARAQTDLLDEVFEDVQSIVCTSKHPVLDDALASKDDFLDHVFEKVESNVCKDHTTIADEDDTNLHWKINLARDSSLLEAIDETPSQSDEECQVEQITILIGNSTVAVVEHSDERSCEEKVNAKDETPPFQSDEECQVDQITVLTGNNSTVAMDEHGPKHSDEKSCEDKVNAKDETSFQSDEEYQVEQITVLTGNNSTVAAVEHGPKHSDEKSCEDKVNASGTSSRATSRGTDKYHVEEEEEPINADTDNVSTYAEDVKAGPEEASKASDHLVWMEECFAFRRDRSIISLSSVSSRASTAVAPSTKALRPAKTIVERRERDHESTSKDEKLLTGASSTGGTRGSTPENAQLWDDGWLLQHGKVITPKRRRNLISKAYRGIFGRKDKR